jgi:hypothetical protein
VDLHNNDIDILEDGLFEFNPNLEVISFTYNKIFHIGSRVFEILTKLHTLNLNENICTELNVLGNPTAIQAAIPNLKNVCRSQTFLILEDVIQHLEEHTINLTRENFWDFEFRFIDFEEEFGNAEFLRFLPLSLRYKFLSELRVENFPESCKKCCQLDEFQAKNLEYFKNITEAIANLKTSQDEGFAGLNAKISKVEAKVDQIDLKIIYLGQILSNFSDNINNFEKHFMVLEDVLAGEFNKVDNEIEQIVPQTTNSILSAVDLKLREMENRLINKIKSNSNND